MRRELGSMLPQTEAVQELKTVYPNFEIYRVLKVENDLAGWDDVMHLSSSAFSSSNLLIALEVVYQ
jgi:hypothetical protein